MGKPHLTRFRLSISYLNGLEDPLFFRTPRETHPENCLGEDGVGAEKEVKCPKGPECKGKARWMEWTEWTECR